MLIYCFSEMCCYWSSCWGLLQCFLDTVLTVLCSWQVCGQGLHSPKEAEESWVMMAQTFCCLDRDLGSPWCPCHSDDPQRGVLLQRTASPSSPLSLGKAWCTSSPPSLHLAIQDLSKCFPITFPLLLSAKAKEVWHLLFTSLTALTHTSHTFRSQIK